MRRSPPKVFKTVIAPVQAWLLSQGRCVGCGRELGKQKSVDWREGMKKITCECGRIFMFDPRTGKFRRALLEEV